MSYSRWSSPAFRLVICKGSAPAGSSSNLLSEPNSFNLLRCMMFARSTPQATVSILIFIIANMIYSRLSPFSRTSAHASKTAETHSGTTTSWISLITAPPIDTRCSNHLYSPDDTYHTLVAFDPHLEAISNITCLPREAAEWYTQKILPFGATTGTVTSLGPMICPKGYTTASQSRKDVTSTMIFCCPSDYAFASSADHGRLYGCTSLQTRKVTVHIPGATPSISTLAAGLPRRAPNIAGLAVNGWIFDPSPMPTSTHHSSGRLTSDVWAREQLGMTTTQFTGIILGTLAGILLLAFTLYCYIRRKRSRRHSKSAAGGINEAGDGAGDLSTSDDRVDLNPPSDIELADLDSVGTRVPSSTDTVVRHVEYPKSEGSSSDEDRTA
jgi:hypothetical protein